MNIQQAKDYIKNAVTIYLKKDVYGDYRIPVVRQRPVFLLGAPGIGKTAIMEQIAGELGIALVSYSMTHHTRQSALGLPFIKQKDYEGMTYDVSEYTMSEIIAAIYETMETSGIKEGILFLDEINCVSETLAPSMLQFLQYKVFGRHSVPEGWVIVTAGNPPEYNKSVREFDVVTMDRLKVLEVEADYPTWRAYAMERNVHSAILNFLELKKEYFYHIETTVKGRCYVTARGWEDLSEIISMYEEEGLLVDESLVGQYIRSDSIVKEFTAYYDLYNKYKDDYKVDGILAGNISESAVEKAKHAAFDERLSLLGMLLDKVQADMHEAVFCSDCLTALMAPLKAVKAAAEKSSGGDNSIMPSMESSLEAGADNKTGQTVLAALEQQALARAALMENMKKANTLSREEKHKHNRILHFLEDAKKKVLQTNVQDEQAAFLIVKERFDSEVADMKAQVHETGERLHHLFAFASQAFSEGNEMLILVTELTVSQSSARYIAMFGCEDYQKYSELLMITERGNIMRENISELVGSVK